MLAEILAFRYRRRLGPFRPLIDPRPQNPDLFARERILLLWHALEISFVARYRQDEKTLGAFATNKQRAGIAAFQPRCFFIEPQSALLLLRAMTLVAIGRQDRLNVFVEVNFPRNRRWNLCSREVCLEQATAHRQGE